MTMVLKDYEVPESKQMLLFTHIRLAHSFSHFKQRTNCILARLQAISVLGNIIFVSTCKFNPFSVTVYFI